VDTYVKQGETGSKIPVLGGIVMFLSYFVSGFIPLGPYLFTNPAAAVKLSIVLSLIALFVLGSIGAKLSNISLLKGGTRMAVIGGCAIGLGIAVGRIIGH
jgi:VIT1/CCC1 family predicted Fe2+/Mn2+ transporter